MIHIIAFFCFSDGNPLADIVFVVCSKSFMKDLIVGFMGIF